MTSTRGFGGDACIVGYVERPSQRHFDGEPRLTIEQWADLAAEALLDAGIEPGEVDGLVCASDIEESSHFVPATIAEYMGWSVDFAERVDLGGATPVGMVWRAAAAIELGVCDVVVMAVAAQPGLRSPVPAPSDDRMLFGASSNRFGSPQAEFEIPYGNVAQNCGFAMYAQRYHSLYGWDERARAKIVVDQRTSALANRSAVFPRQADHDRRRARLQDDRRTIAHARDRHALLRRCRHRDVLGRTGGAHSASARACGRIR